MTKGLLSFAAAACLATGSLLAPSAADAAAVLTISPTGAGVAIQGSGVDCFEGVCLELGPGFPGNEGIISFIDNTGAGAGSFASVATFHLAVVTGGPISTGDTVFQDAGSAGEFLGGNAFNTVLNGLGVIIADQGHIGGAFSEAELDGISTVFVGETFESLGLIAGASMTFSVPDIQRGLGDLTIQVVPIPAAAWLFGSALGLLGWVRRRAT